MDEGRSPGPDTPSPPLKATEPTRENAIRFSENPPAPRAPSIFRHPLEKFSLTSSKGVPPDDFRFSF